MSKTTKIFIGVTVLVLLFLITCNHYWPLSGIGGRPRVDTVGKTTRTIVTVIHDTVADHQPEVIQVIEGGRIPDLIDTAAILRQFHEKVVYKDSIQTKVGFLRIYDTVYENRLMPRQIFLDQSQPEVVNTVLLNEHRSQVFLGVSGQGGPGLPSAFGPSMMLNTKTGTSYEVGPMLNIATGKIGVHVSIKKLISFKRRK